MAFATMVIYKETTDDWDPSHEVSGLTHRLVKVSLRKRESGQYILKLQGAAFHGCGLGFLFDRKAPAQAMLGHLARSLY